MRGMNISEANVRRIVRDELLREFITTNFGQGPIERKLNNVEFIALKMSSNPGQPASFYMRELARYKSPRGYKEATASGQDPREGAYYFNPRYGADYVDVLWSDSSTPNVEYDSFANSPSRKYSVGRRPLRSKKGAWFLTPAGETKAEKARQKLGVSSSGEVK